MAHDLCSKCRKLRYRTDPCMGSEPCPLKLRLATVAAKFQAPDTGHSEGRGRTKPKPVGQARRPANPRAKATKANPRDDATAASEADGVASRSSGGDGSAAPITIVHHRVHDLSAEGLKAIAEGLAKKRGRPIKANPKSPRAAYQRELMRRKRAEKTAGK